jgi:GT2 family glycosyltransferase
MDIEDLTSPRSDEAISSPQTRRYRELSERLGAEADAARGDARRARAECDAAEAAREALSVRLIESRIAGWQAERARRLAVAELARARALIAKTDPALRESRTLLASMQLSKFWKLRNAWFGLKQRLGRHDAGPQPFWVPDVDPELDVWKRDQAYAAWLLGNEVRASDRARMRELMPLLRLTPTFSVIVPVYETPERYLRAAIESVIAQVYPHWELCIADDASPSTYVGEILDEYARAEPRIRVVRRERNGHISEASNSALAMATGEFVALLDHDDLLTPDALFENALVVNRRPDVDVIYSDEDKIDDDGRRHDAYFKPDWSPESLLARNYVSHLGVYRRSLVTELGGFRTGFEGSQDYDLVLRATERSDRVAHIPRVLYHWRVHEASTASSREQKGYAYDAAVRALGEALERRDEPGTILTDERIPGIYTVRYALRRPEKVSIVIPTRDHGQDVDLCVSSIFERSTYDDFEIVLVDNGSRDAESLRIFGRWADREPRRFRVASFDVPFNFSRINNYGVAQSDGTYVLFLNNDTEVITPDWLEAMVEQAQRPPIGAVGAKLLYDDGTIQHAGVIVGIGGVAGHSHKHAQRDEPGYFGTLQTVNNFSALTAACLMLRRDVFDAVGGFDESLAVAFNDVDFCLRIRERGFRNVYLPHVELYHYESKSRGYENTPEKMDRFLREQRVMQERWQTGDLPDPYYNPNLSLESEDYAIRP